MTSGPDVEQRKANVIAVVHHAIKELRGADFQARRRGIVLLAQVLGHHIGLAQVKDQAWGAVGECVNCGQVAKAARDGDTIEGRAIHTICPAQTLFTEPLCVNAD
jgi:hypothetical protein